MFRMCHLTDVSNCDFPEYYMHVYDIYCTVHFLIRGVSVRSRTASIKTAKLLLIEQYVNIANCE